MSRNAELAIGFLCGIALLVVGGWRKEWGALGIGAFIAGLFLGKLDERSR